jgi:ATP synthase protein I
MPDEPSNGPEKSLVRQLAELSAAGLQFTASIAGAALIGWYLDERFDTQPWLLLIMVLVGIAGGFLMFMRTLRILSGPDRDGQA